MASLEQSLKNLATDHVDVYICHRPDPLTPLEETLRALDAVVCSGNPHKLEEFEVLFPDWTLSLLEGAAFPPETGRTYLENARGKAAFGRRVGPADRWMLADDSGIEVDALGGVPGVRTRRYAGEDATDEENNGKLLAALDGLPPEKRGARYVCVLALALPGGAGPRGGVTVTMTRGTCRGRIATGPRGTGGFGYDPIFEPASEPPGGRTLGLWTPAEKNAISHRARAARRMAPKLAALGF
jgi:XTP/dITP diphosphohydrolase